MERKKKRIKIGSNRVAPEKDGKIKWKRIS